MRNLLLSSIMFVSSLIANPQNPTVAAGMATFDNSDPNLMHVTATSDRTIVNWGSFSIDASEKTLVTLPAKTSAILNRVSGAFPSTLKGASSCQNPNT